MHKSKPRQEKTQLFSFNNSFKNSCVATPESSNNASFHNLFSASLKSNQLDSFSLVDSASPFLLSNKENCQARKMNLSSRSKEKSINKSQGLKRDVSSKKKLTSSTSFKGKQKPLKQRQIQNLPNIQFDLSSGIKSQPQPQAKPKKTIQMNLDSKQASFPEKTQQNIKVFVRMRPKEEEDTQEHNSLQLIDSNIVKAEENYFCFDHIFNQQSSQQSVFDHVGSDICNKLFEGYNGTIFAYGQTGSGKTYTIFGQNSCNKQGLIYRSIKQILHLRSNVDGRVQIKCSMAELYKEKVIDMLGTGTDLKLKQSKSGQVYIEGLKQIPVDSQLQILKQVKQAAKRRKVTSTKLNQQSSRSHTILTVYLHMPKWTTKLCLIDLAGSEKVLKSGAQGEAFEETKKINSSLSCLGNVINALTTRGKTEHIPFRDSKITRLLKDSLTGKFLTSMIINCSLSPKFLTETISSLKFAERAKKIKVNVHNMLEQQKQKETITHLHEVIKRLQSDLENTTHELNNYKEKERGESRCSKQKLNSRKRRIFVNIPAAYEKYRQQSTAPAQEERSQSCESQMTARNPIPSQRAQVDEKIKRYNEMVEVKTQPNTFFLPQFSSLNVSKSIRPLDNSPDLSSLQYKCDESPDISLSFSIHGESKTGRQT